MQNHIRTHVCFALAERWIGFHTEISLTICACGHRYASVESERAESHRPSAFREFHVVLNSFIVIFRQMTINGPPFHLIAGNCFHCHPDCRTKEVKRSDLRLNMIRSCWEMSLRFAGKFQAESVLSDVNENPFANENDEIVKKKRPKLGQRGLSAGNNGL